MKKTFLIVACVLSSLMLFSCGNQTEEASLTEPPTQAVNEIEKETSSKETPTEAFTTAEETSKVESTSEVVINYGDAESFENDILNGLNLEGKIVKFIVRDFKPASAFGFNLISGEHLNFVSTEHPNAQIGDELVVKATSISNFLGSWIIRYEKVDNAVITEDTTFYNSSETPSESQ